MNKAERAARAKARQAAAARAKAAAALKKRNEREAKEKQGKYARPETVPIPPIKPMVDDLPQKPKAKLALIVGPGPLTLRQTSQLVWAYVQRNGFQDREQPHMIRIKAERGKAQPLKDIIGEKPISMFELTEKLREHLG
jgi:chromatin remodeling complex protein RSC6